MCVCVCVHVCVCICICICICSICICICICLCMLVSLRQSIYHWCLSIILSTPKDAYRLRDVAVVVSNQPFPSPAATRLQEPDYTLCGQNSGIPPARSTTIFACAGAPLVARYVYVYIPTLSTPLTLCEVEVFSGGKSALKVSRNLNGHIGWRHRWHNKIIENKKKL